MNGGCDWHCNTFMIVKFRKIAQKKSSKKNTSMIDKSPHPFKSRRADFTCRVFERLTSFATVNILELYTLVIKLQFSASYFKFLTIE